MRIGPNLLVAILFMLFVLWANGAFR